MVLNPVFVDLTFKHFANEFNLPPVVLVIVLSVLLSEAMDSLRRQEIWSIVVVSVLVLMLIFTSLIIWRQPQNTTQAAFMVSHKITGDGHSEVRATL